MHIRLFRLPGMPDSMYYSTSSKIILNCYIKKNLQNLLTYFSTKTCPSGTLFDQTTSLCVSEVDCLGSPTTEDITETTAVGFTCTEDGYYSENQCISDYFACLACPIPCITQPQVRSFQIVI